MFARHVDTGFTPEMRIRDRTSRTMTMTSMNAARMDREAREGSIETRRAAGDQVNVLKLMALEFGAIGAWTRVEDRPADLLGVYTDVWECSDNGYTVIHTKIGPLFLGHVFDDKDRTLARLVGNEQDEADLRRYHDVVALKADWDKDPSWDLEDTDGFEGHVDELREHAARRKREWAEKAQSERRAKLEAKMAEIGTDDAGVAQYVIDLEDRMARLEARIDGLEGR